MQLLHGALTYRDRRLAGFDAAAVVEVVEHLDPPRLPAFEEAVFGVARPGTVVLTTPEPGVQRPVRNSGCRRRMRHPDHRFEWSRAEFRAWAEDVSSRCGYAVRIEPVGEADPELGAPTQMGVFTRCALSIPDFSLVVLIGPSGSGKSTFARRCFRPTEVVSSDACRALVADDETDQAATPARLRGAPPHRRPSA